MPGAETAVVSHGCARSIEIYAVVLVTPVAISKTERSKLYKPTRLSEVGVSLRCVPEAAETQGGAASPVVPSIKE